MLEDLQAQLEQAVLAVLDSAAPRKLIVAGPGTGKIWQFQRVLERIVGPNNGLVLTFINNLKNDLERDLGALAEVFTFHGYRRTLRHR
jgi:hypothetical protein